ncbi:MAG TPA: hypothetical protein VFE09_09900, partial [Rubrobacteraceae bacterium]|nr:hypothetical protein [Rubrobacteraceae bacterium]
GVGMGKRFWSIVAATGLVAAALSQSMIAQAVTKIPAKVQIEDPLNDANFLNDQDFITGTPVDGTGDNTTAADAGSVSDFLKVWFSNTKKTISVHILTERPPPAISTIYYRIAANPGEGEIGANTGRGCLNWRMIFPGQQTVNNNTVDTSTYRSSDPTKPASLAEFEDVCNVEGRQHDDIKVTVETLEDDTGITTMTVPRSVSPLFAKGGKITLPYAIARVAVGQNGTELPTGGDFFSAATTDTTKRGSDYVIKDKKRRR